MFFQKIIYVFVLTWPWTCFKWRFTELRANMALQSSRGQLIGGLWLDLLVFVIKVASQSSKVHENLFSPPKAHRWMCWGIWVYVTCSPQYRKDFFKFSWIFSICRDKMLRMRNINHNHLEDTWLEAHEHFGYGWLDLLSL